MTVVFQPMRDKSAKAVATIGFDATQQKNDARRRYRDLVIGLVAFAVMLLIVSTALKLAAPEVRERENVAALRGSGDKPVDTGQAWRGALMKTADVIQSATQPCFNTADGMDQAWGDAVASGSFSEFRANAQDGARICQKAEYALDAMPLPSSIPGDIAEPLGKAKLFCSLAMMRLVEVHRTLANTPFETMSVSEKREASTSFKAIADAYLERLTECRIQIRQASSAVTARRMLDD